MSLWTCDKCGWQGRVQQKRGHSLWRCPEQGNMRKALKRQEKATNTQPKPVATLLCECGCGTAVAQTGKAKPKRFVDMAHFERWRAPQRTAAAQREAAKRAKAIEQQEEAREARRLAAEVAPVLRMEAECSRAAEAVPMVTGDASFRLWARCLGFAVDVAPVEA